MTLQIGLLGAGRMGEVFAHQIGFNNPEAELRDFVVCIIEDREPAVAAVGRAAVAIGVAATRSLDESRPVLISEV